MLAREGIGISPKKKLAIVATTAVIALLLVVVGLASLAPKSKPQSVNELPVASFTYAADNLTVEFNASASSDPDGDIANYSWSFGDESTGHGVMATHAYAANGTYGVQLTVTDDKGEKNSTKKSLTVSKPMPPAKKKPVAEIDVVSVDEWKVVLSGAKSRAPEGGVLKSYEWEFSDGGTATGVDVEYTFSENGTYTVKLTVTDDKGETDTATVEVTVEKPSTPPPPPPPPPPPHLNGPPGLLKAIEIHEEKADRNDGLQNSLEKLKDNLERWLENHLTLLF